MSAQRSVQITLNNQTSQNLQLSSATLSHGIWSDGQQPPQVISANGSGTFASESQGFATGVQGVAIYSFQGGIVTLNWDNPFVGTSSYTGNVSNPAFSLTVDVVQEGNNASVIYTLTNS